MRRRFNGVTPVAGDDVGGHGLNAPGPREVLGSWRAWSCSGWLGRVAVSAGAGCVLRAQRLEVSATAGCPGDADRLDLPRSRTAGIGASAVRHLGRDMHAAP